MEFYGNKAKEQQEVNKAQAAAEAAKILAEHEVAKGETLSDIAMKYYKHAAPPYWKLIFEANQAVIGKSERDLKAGMKIKIPVLPATLAGKE